MKKALATIVAVLLVGYAGYAIFSGLGEPDFVANANMRVLMDSETGEQFEIEISPDTEPYPHVNPKTGTTTLFPTEVCYARGCGSFPKGTRVILNVWLDKKGPTYCPNCGALVVPMNPDARLRSGG